MTESQDSPTLLPSLPPPTELSQPDQNIEPNFPPKSLRSSAPSPLATRVLFEGINNLGNTCYLTSVISVISNLSPFVSIFLSRDLWRALYTLTRPLLFLTQQPSQQTITDSPHEQYDSDFKLYLDFLRTQFEIAYETASCIFCMSHPHNVSISPELLFNLITLKSSSFILGRPADAEEFLTFLFSSIDDELKCILSHESSVKWIELSKNMITDVSNKRRKVHHLETSDTLPISTQIPVLWTDNPISFTLAVPQSLFESTDAQIHPIFTSITNLRSFRSSQPTSTSPLEHCAFSGELLNPVQQTFNCVITSDLTCPKCGATTTKPEIQRVINLRFQETSQNTQFSLEYLLSNAFQPPQTDFECDSCHQKVPSTKPYFSIAPRVLVLSINRFKFESSVSKKLRHSVTFPGVLDLSPFTQPSTLVPAPLKHLHPLPPIFSDSAWKRGLNEDDIIEHKMEDAVISFLEDHFSSRRITLQNLPLPEIPREQEYLLSLGEFLAVGEHLGFHNGPTHGQPQSHSRDVMDEETIDCEALHQINVEEEEQKQAESLDRLFAVLETCPHPNDPHSPTTIRATLPFAIDITSSLFFQFAHEKNLKRRMNRTLDTEFVEILKTKHPFNIDLVSIPPLDRRSEIYKQYGFPMKKPKPPIQRKLNEPPPRRSTTLPSGHPYPTLKPTLLSQVPRLSHLTPSPFHPLERRISNNQMNFSLNKSSGHPLGGVASFIRHAQPIPSSSRHSDNWDTRFLSVNIPQPNISISRGYNMGGHPEPEIIGEIAQKQKRDHPTPSNPVEFKSPPILQTLGVFGDHVEIIENTDSEAEAISFQISETLVDEFGNEEILDRLIDSSERGGLLGGGKDSDFIDDGTSGDDTINATDSEGGMDASTVPMLDHQYQPLEHPRHSHRPYQTTIEVFPQDDSMSADGLWNYPLTRSQSSIEPNHPPHLTPLPNSQPAKEKGAEDAGSFERVRVGADERVFGVPGSNFVYELSGIILHSGKSVTRGHYETYVKNINTQEWMHINDSQTKVVDLDTILAQENVKQDCYLLFYTHTGSVKDQ